MSAIATMSTPRHVALFPAETSLGWRVIKRVPLALGLRKEAQGKWRRVLDETTRSLIGFQIISTSVERGDRDVPSIHSSAAISRAEMEINAMSQVFADARSRTAGMSEDHRKEREAIGGLAEDRAERVQCKVIVYPYVNGKKGDILRVWPAGKTRPSV